MSRILILGGYGGFGARLSRRMVAAGHEVLIAGRTVAKAAALCGSINREVGAPQHSRLAGRSQPQADGGGGAQVMRARRAPSTSFAGPPPRPGEDLGIASPHGRATPLVADRNHDLTPILVQHRPDLVIDAAGPFQGSNYAVPEACIAHRIPYLDLADARDFVCGIGALDAAARAAGVAVIAGASSVPALSGAILRRLAQGLDRVDSVEMALSASNRASAGESIAAAMLSYIGRPMRVWRGRSWATTHGWQELRRERFGLSDGAGLGGRLVGVADVPDHAIVPEALQGRPATTFRAGTELDFQMLALWLLSWPVRWRWIDSLLALRRVLMPLYRLTYYLGGDRSAMSITLKGRTGAQGLERRWTIVARHGDGPEIPTLAARILAGDVLAGNVAAGARHAWFELTPERFEPLFAQLSVRHETTARVLVPLYARAMGAAFDALPPMVQAIHRVYGDAAAAGEGHVERGMSPLARLLGSIMRMPAAGSYPLHVAFAERNGRERWTRDFGGHVFSSELSAARGGVTERFGPLRFVFDLPADRAGLAMVLRGWSLFRLPLPRWLAPRIAAREWQEDERFRFEVSVAMPLIGPIVRYSGWLRPIE